MNTHVLSALGWNAHWQELFETSPQPLKNTQPARVIRTEREHYVVQTAEGVFWAKTAGLMRHHNKDLRDWPLIGDWVAVKEKKNSEHFTIFRVLPRTTLLCRQQAGERGRGEQPIAANVDFALLVASLEGGRHFNENRVERFMGLVVSQNITPMVVLNKTDLATEEQLNDALTQSKRLVGDGQVFTTSALDGSGVDIINQAIAPGETGILIGLSGAGKTSLFNKLTNRDHAVNEVRENDRRGRHTTTSRLMEPMPHGGLLIDTPGIREWQVADTDTIDDAFDDILHLSAQCRFRNCAHISEPGCAVQQALADGTIEQRRYDNFINMKTNRNCRPRAEKRDGGRSTEEIEEG